MVPELELRALDGFGVDEPVGCGHLVIMVLKNDVHTCGDDDWQG